MEMVRGCEVVGSNAVSCLIDGIEDNYIKAGAVAGRYTTPETLYSEYLATLPSTSMAGNQVNKNFNKRERFSKANHYMQTNPNKGNDNFKGQKINIKCFNCQKVGHYRNKCPKPMKKCGKCQRNGHISSECKSKSICTPEALHCSINEKEIIHENYHVY